jgi:hypothetical protein
VRTVPRSLEEILAHADELADTFESYEPKPEDESKASSLVALRLAAARRAEADRALLQATVSGRRVRSERSESRVTAKPLLT